MITEATIKEVMRREETLLDVRLDYLVRDSLAVLDSLLKARNGTPANQDVESSLVFIELDEAASLQQEVAIRLIQLRDRVSSPSPERAVRDGMLP